MFLPSERKLWGLTCFVQISEIYFQNPPKSVDIPAGVWYTNNVKGNRDNMAGKSQKGEKMEDEMSNISEILVAKVEENQTRKIIEILNECGTLEEAKTKIKALLNK